VNETIAQMQQRLTTLQPDSVDIVDDSAKHVGHAGAASGGGHYQLTIVSKQFAGKPQVARHRLIYQALGDLMQRQIHALSITAYTPDQL
jgi:BolA family transcriptional regulator, general stress-responsive regulator